MDKKEIISQVESLLTRTELDSDDLRGILAFAFGVAKQTIKDEERYDKFVAGHGRDDLVRITAQLAEWAVDFKFGEK